MQRHNVKTVYSPNENLFCEEFLVLSSNFKQYLNCIIELYSLQFR